MWKGSCRILRRILSPSMSRPRMEDHNCTNRHHARSGQSACAHTAIVNSAALMDGEILILAPQCVSNVVLFASSTTRILSTSQNVADNDHCEVILTTSQKLKRHRAPPLPYLPEFLELRTSCDVLVVQHLTLLRHQSPRYHDEMT